MLTIARLTKYSIKYYNDTADAPKQAAMDRQQANGGLAEYYSEGETRIPTWLVVGDKQLISQATGLTDAELEGGDANTDDVRIWLDDGQSPNGKASREFTDNSVYIATFHWHWDGRVFATSALDHGYRRGEDAEHNGGDPQRLFRDEIGAHQWNI